MTVQALPDRPRRSAIGQVGRVVAPGGTLLVIAAGRDEAEDSEKGSPWPVTRAEVEAFAIGDLRAMRIEDICDNQEPRVPRSLTSERLCQVLGGRGSVRRPLHISRHVV